MAESIKCRPFDESDKGPLATLWNDTFKDMRNFMPVSEDVLNKYIFHNRNAIEAFDPGGFIVAEKDGEIVGFVHAGVRNETFCKTAYPDWPGGSEGYVGMIAVAAPARRNGVGTALMNAAKKYLYGTTRIIVDGQCLNPFYGNSAGPAPALWGTTEGASVPSGDQAVRALFDKFGFEKRYTAVSMELNLSSFKKTPVKLPDGFTSFSENKSMPAPGAPVDLKVPLNGDFDFEAVAVESGGIVAAAGSRFPMKGVNDSKDAIYEIKVLPDFRSRGLGSYIINELIKSAEARGATVMEVLTVPDLSPGAEELYAAFGFKEAAKWDIY